MQLHYESKLYKWAYGFEDKNYWPKTVNLCPFFWRCVLLAPFARSILASRRAICWCLRPIGRFLTWLVDTKIGPRMEAWENRRYQRRAAKLNQPYKIPEPNIFELTWDFLVAKKRQLCPRITVEGFPKDRYWYDID